MVAENSMDAGALRRAYQAGALSPVETVRSVLDRITSCEPRINAMYRILADSALRDAQASQERWRAGRPLSALDGVPVTAKDNIASAGDPMPLGTAANAEAAPQRADSPAVSRLREAGCILVGKTTMPDYGMLSSGLSSFHALARNPWDLSRTPGGSSAGAGAAGAAGYGPLHVGTDIGGSVRLPAGWCGIVGLKPSAGRVPIDPPDQRHTPRSSWAKADLPGTGAERAIYFHC